MKRIVLYIWYILALAGMALGQFTTVTGTVTDPNGLAYSFGTIASTIVASGTPLFSSNSQPYLQPSQATSLDINGKFVVRLADNTQISPGGSTWTFKVCSAAGTVQPAFGTGPQCFTVTGQTISGSSQDITSALHAAAVALTATFAAGGITGAGTSGFIPEWTSSTALGNSLLQHAANTGYTGTQSSVTSGTVTNTYFFDNAVSVPTGSQVLTNVYDYGCKVSSPNGSTLSGSWANAWCLYIKSPFSATGNTSTTSVAGIHIEDQHANYPGFAGATVDGINIAAHTQDTGSSTYAIRSFGPHNFAGYTNHSQSKVLSSGVATSFIKVQSPEQSSGQSTNWAVGGQVNFCVIVQLNQSTVSPSLQSNCGTFGYSAVSNQGTITTNVGTVTNTSSVVTTGTLTATFGAVTAGASMAIQVTATSSLTSPTITLFYDTVTYGSDTWGDGGTPQ